MPDRLQQYRELALTAHQPEESPAESLMLADYFEERGDVRMAATALDRAYGLSPDDQSLAARRRELLLSLTLVEHGIRFRYVPAGTFLMGSDNGDEDEQPVHAVRLEDYWVSETAVTWAAYCQLLGWSPPPAANPHEEFADRMMGFSLHQEHKIRLQYCETETTGARDWHAHQPDTKWSSGETSREIFGEVPRDNTTRPWEYDEKPMVAVSWQSAEELCRAISTPKVEYRLPSEAEWEKAARGALIQQAYSWGDTPPNAQNCDFDHFGAFYIRPPHSLPPNGYGIYGMCGGVCEWTRDRYDRAAYDPRVAPSTDEPQPRALRGGSWSDCAEAVRVSFRFARGSSYWRELVDFSEGRSEHYLGHMSPTIGFRLFRFER